MLRRTDEMVDDMARRKWSPRRSPHSILVLSNIVIIIVENVHPRMPLYKEAKLRTLVDLHRCCRVVWSDGVGRFRDEYRRSPIREAYVERA